MYERYIKQRTTVSHVDLGHSLSEYWQVVIILSTRLRNYHFLFLCPLVFSIWKDTFPPIIFWMRTCWILCFYTNAWVLRGSTDEGIFLEYIMQAMFLTFFIIWGQGSVKIISYLLVGSSVKDTILIWAF